MYLKDEGEWRLRECNHSRGHDWTNIGWAVSPQIFSVVMWCFDVREYRSWALAGTEQLQTLQRRIVEVRVQRSAGR